MALHTPLNDTFNGIALCADIGGLELGLHIAEPGYRSVCYVEREAYAASTLVARMGDKALDNAPISDDVTTFEARPWRGKVHILTGGYPCQPFSFAGRRKGEKDPRHLWPHVRRITDELRPEWCFLENVEGHLTLGAAEVFADLRSLGYSVKAGMFSALETGASQIRRRLFIVAQADEIPLLQQNRDGVFQRRAETEERPNAIGLPDRAGKGGAALDDDLAGDESVRRETDDGFQLPPIPARSTSV